MLAFKLAFRNLFGAGLRTWLNVSVLSFAFVVIIFYNGMLEGWNIQARNDTKDWQVGNGEFWHPDYDPYDPFTFSDSHGILSEEVLNLIAENKLTPILVTQATIYPQGRMENIILNGINSGQKILKLPVFLLDSARGNLPAIIGKRMAESCRLKKDDRVLIRWRDRNGTFDATEVTIAGIFDCNVPSVDMGQIWIPLESLQSMTGLKNEASFLVAGKDMAPGTIQGWVYKDLKYLLAEINTIIQSKKAGASIIYLLLLSIALLAIFDTQVLSIFRRQKEIGTYIALGMTRYQVVGLFTVEGGAHSILATILGAVYGIPLLMYINQKGISMPAGTDKMGLSVAQKLFPAYSLTLILSTVALVIISATIVSFLPARKITKMNPTEALKGKLQ
jgi:putative ABC transport system permease protein